MITWMQRHHKWLVITIWISTIAFIGAGFFGWGQYNYASKSGNIAKVGNINITYKEFDQRYNQTFARYKQMFHGKFDKSQAKSMGLQQSVLANLVDQALVLNLAQSYHLNVSDMEIYDALKTQKVFYKDGHFDDKTYKSILAQNNITPHTYESSLRKQLLIEKTLKLFPMIATALEVKTLGAVFNIQDKISYKVLDFKDIHLKPSEKDLKAFWKDKKQYFLTQPGYDITYIRQKPVEKTYTQQHLVKYYDRHKLDFTDQQGKIQPLAVAKPRVIAALNQQATKIAALETYIAFKKNKLDKKITTNHAVINSSTKLFSPKVLQKIQALQQNNSYLKPQLVDHRFVIIKLNKKLPAQPKSFQAAKPDVLQQYMLATKTKKLLELAKKSYKNFTGGKTTPFITIKDVSQLEPLSKKEAAHFLTQFFQSKQANGYIELPDNKIVMYRILEQKLLSKEQKDIASDIIELKQQLLNQNLIKMLNERFKTEIYRKGL